jgi:hypothetical protein
MRMKTARYSIHANFRISKKDVLYLGNRIMSDKGEKRMRGARERENIPDGLWNDVKCQLDRKAVGLGSRSKPLCRIR